MKGFAIAAAILGLSAVDPAMGADGAPGPTPQAVKPGVQRATKEVSLGDGLFRKAFEADVRYLLDAFTVDDLLLLFRRRAGKPAPGKAPHWDTSFPGTYAVIDRTWRAGDAVSLALPMGFRAARYAGENEIKGYERWALEYGPVLLAFAGPLGKEIPAHVRQDPRKAAEWLTPAPGKPLHFTVRGLDGFTVMPYWQVPHDQPFTCFPVMGQ
jgi:hypothetical protein